MSELSSIDFVFQIETILDFDANQANTVHDTIVDLLKPNYIITCQVADRFWQEKEKRAERIGAKLLILETDKPTHKIESSTTKIVQMLKKEL